MYDFHDLWPSRPRSATAAVASRKRELLLRLGIIGVEIASAVEGAAMAASGMAAASKQKGDNLLVIEGALAAFLLFAVIAFRSTKRTS